MSERTEARCVCGCRDGFHHGGRCHGTAFGGEPCQCVAFVLVPPSGEPVGEPEICGRVSPDGRVVCTAIAGHPMPHHHHLTGFSWSTGEPETFAPLSPLSPDERAMRWAATVTALESRLLAAEAARARAEQERNTLAVYICKCGDPNCAVIRSALALATPEGPE